MFSTTNNSVWESAVYSQDGGDTDWYSYQPEYTLNKVENPFIYKNLSTTTNIFATTSTLNSLGSDGTNNEVIVENTSIGTLVAATVANLPSYGNRTSYVISSQDTVGQGLFFSTGGTKMYMLGDTANTVYQYTLSTAWDLTTASYDNKSFSVGSQETSPHGIYISIDGKNMYIVGPAQDTGYQYTLSTAWDVSTATYSNKSCSFSAQDTAVQGIFFDSSGTKLYITGSTYTKVYQYTLSTAWDISTAYYISKSYTIANDGTPVSTVFTNDGKKMIVLGYVTKTLYQYTLSTAWDVSTAAVAFSYNFSTIDSSPQAIYINPLNNKIFILGDTNNTVYGLSVGDLYNSRTATYNSKFISTSTQSTNPVSVNFNNDGTKMYVCGGAVIYQYTLSTAWEVSTASYATKSFSVSSQDSSPYSINIGSSGTVLYMIGINNKTVYQYTLSTAWDISTASYASKSYLVTTQDTTPRCAIVSYNGTKMYILGDTNNAIYQYTLSTAWDVSTASYDSIAKSISSQDAAPLAIAFNKSGTRLLMLGDTSNTVYTYTLSTAWDISTASFTTLDSFAVSSQDSLPFGVCYDDIGLRIYVVGDTNNRVFQYDVALCLSDLYKFDISSYGFSTAPTLYNSGIKYKVHIASTAANCWLTEPTYNASSSTTSSITISNDNSINTLFNMNDSITISGLWKDVSVASYINRNYSVTTQDSAPSGVYFSSDGTKMYTFGTSNNKVFQYTLSTAWDISTATYATKFLSVTTQTSYGTTCTFNTDGTKVYVGSNVGDIIYQYNMSTAWDISTATYATKSLDTSGLVGTLRAIVFNTLGTKLYVLSVSSSYIYQYTLSTAWDLATATYSNLSFSCAEDSLWTQLFFSSDGINLYMSGNTNDKIYQYVLSTAWDISTCSYTSKSFTVTQSAGADGVFFKSTGTEMYVIVQGTTDYVYQYSFLPSTTTTVTSVSGTTINFPTQTYKPANIVNTVIPSVLYTPTSYTIDTNTITANFAVESALTKTTDPRAVKIGVTSENTGVEVTNAKLYMWKAP